VDVDTEMVVGKVVITAKWVEVKKDWVIWTCWVLTTEESLNNLTEKLN